MSAHLDGTYGAVFIAMVLAAVLYGISCVQALYYYTNQKDTWYIKLMVTAIMLLDTAHQALITHSIYTYTITDWGESAQLLVLVRTVVIEIILTGITAFIVQGFLIVRIWRLSGRNMYLTGVPVALAIGGFVTICIYMSKLLPLEFVTQLPGVKDISVTINVFNAVTDLIIAATLCVLLNTSRTGFQRSEIIINRLILFTVNTGLLTSLCAMCSVITILVSSDTYLYIAFFFCLGRLYTNTLLATLNARGVIRNVNNQSGTFTDVSFPLRDFQSGGTNQNLSVKIDTVTQQYNISNEKIVDGTPTKSPYSDEESANAEKVPY